MTKLWRVLLNGKYFGIIESDLIWASRYWASKCSKGKHYQLEAVK